MPISFSTEDTGAALVVHLDGRLDAHAASEVEPSLEAIEASRAVVMDLTRVSYISSAGIRIFVGLHKRLTAKGGRLLLAGLQPYCREVFKVSALDQFFSLFETAEAALAETAGGPETRKDAHGKFVFHQGFSEPGYIEVLGKIDDVLAARITEKDVWPKRFSAKAFSLGLGGMAPTVGDVMPLMGEMITIGGTMVWLPTDGNDTPDFLVPHQDSDQVVIQTGFNASLAGKFNEYVEFESTLESGSTLAEVYASLLEFSRQRRPDYRGALMLAMRAEVSEVYGCGVVKAPILANAPTNGLPVTDPSNYSSWFEYDETPRHRNVTGLICGIGVDLDADLSVFNQEYLNATFYINPGNKTADSHGKLHNHGVFFNPLPWSEGPFSLEREIQSVVEAGEFIDMRHLFDKTTIRKALIGVVYVRDFCADPEV